MQAAEYFDSIAQFWDMEYSDHEQAREITAAISVPRGGGYALDIGCGSGGMILDLLRYGACEIEGIDFSEAMAEMARQKYSFDPRVSIETVDFFALERSGFDLAVAFNSYQYFRYPGAFIAKAYSLLREGGRAHKRPERDAAGRHRTAAQKCSGRSEGLGALFQN